MEYEIVIGLEVHSELATKSKIYCTCTTEYGGEPNTHCCPICTGMPGVLPVLNKRVVEFAVKAGLATNCDIAGFSKQDRKNYFYPDLPKAYQVSQFDLPLCKGGYIEISSGEDTKKIGITRIHIEEDAARLMHDEWDTGSLIDYNRCGVPLIEIVSEPDMRSAQEVDEYLRKLKAILEYTGVSDCKMQEGSLRADVNLSVRPVGQKEFGTRTEMKNLNSFRSIERAIESETKRQISELEDGRKIIQETRRWDDTKGMSFSMRSKEEAHDYRYFPEPDLAPIVVGAQWLEEIRSSIPELPEQRKTRYINEYGLPEYDADIITSSMHLSDFFDGAISATKNIKAVSNWIMGDLLKNMKESSAEMSDIPFDGVRLAELINMIDSGRINGTIGKKVFEKMFADGRSPEAIVKEDGLEVVNDEGVLLDIVLKVMQANGQSVSDYKAGKLNAIGFLTGQCMKESRGKGNPQMFNKLLKEKLDN